MLFNERLEGVREALRSRLALMSYFGLSSFFRHWQHVFSSQMPFAKRLDGSESDGTWAI